MTFKLNFRTESCRRDVEQSESHICQIFASHGASTTLPHFCFSLCRDFFFFFFFPFRIFLSVFVFASDVSLTLTWACVRSQVGIFRRGRSLKGKQGKSIVNEVGCSPISTPSGLQICGFSKSLAKAFAPHNPQASFQ